MGQVNEPVSACTITFKYLYWTPDRKDKTYYQDRFATIPELREYFKRFPSAGALVGYGKPIPGNVFAFEATLILEWTDKTSTVRKEFTDANAFVKFLSENPLLAKSVAFEVKAK